MSDERRRGVGGSAPSTDPSAPYARTTPALHAPLTPEIGTDPTLHAASEPSPDGTLDLPAGDQVASAGAFEPGQVIGHFVIRARLGEGGMGLVLAGHDADLGRAVAIKVVKSDADHPAYRARLLREAQAMARIEHPNVVRVYEVGSDRGRLFVAMELVDGVTLSTWLRVQRRTWREVVAIFAQIGAGLAVVHRAGFVHRDFKPDNVLVDRDGRARVADFGLARFDPARADVPASPELAASLTRTGMMMGTPGYMAPEQQFGGHVDARADQYSYCVALREALLGRRPAKIEDADWGSVPRSVRAVVARGLSYDPAERFASFDELLLALARAGTRRVALVGGAIAATILAGSAAAAVIVMSTGGEPEVARPGEPAPAVVASVPADAAPSVPPDAASRVVGPGPTIVAVGSASQTVPIATIPPRRETTARRSERKAPAPERRTSTPAVTLRPAPPFATPGVTPPAPPAKPVRHEMIAGHRGAVRDAIRELGYGGLTITGNDHAADIAELRDKLAASTDDLERGAFLYGIGAAERRRGDCTAATRAWAEARRVLVAVTKKPLDSAAHEQRRTQAFRFMGRTWVGQGMCELGSGRALAATKSLDSGARNLFGVAETERAEVWFAWGIATWETGDADHGKNLMIQAGRRGTDELRRAITQYTRAVGLALD